MPLVVPDLPIPRVPVGERVAVNRRAIAQPGEIAADLMAVRLAAAGRQRPPLEPAQILPKQRRATVVDSGSLLDAEDVGGSEAAIRALDAIDRTECRV